MKEETYSRVRNQLPFRRDRCTSGNTVYKGRNVYDGPSGAGRREHTQRDDVASRVATVALSYRFAISGDTSGIARSARSPRGAQRYYSHAAD